MRLFLEIYNGEPVPRERIPRLAFEDFRHALTEASDPRCRVSALFGYPSDGGIGLLAVLAADDTGTLLVTQTTLSGDSYPSFTPERPEVHLFERELAETWGLKPLGHPWLKPVRFLHSRRPGHDAWGRADAEAIIPGVIDFYRVKGEEIHAVAVGPVHSGVIEPGPFRFQCRGEHVFNL